MRAKRLEAILGSALRVSEAEMVQRFQKLRDINLLPVSRGRNAESINSDAVVSGLLSVIDERPGFAGMTAKMLRILRPVGGPDNAFVKATTFAEALRALLDNEASLNALIEVHITNSEIYTNSYGRGAIFYRDGNIERVSYYVGATAVSLFQAGKQTNYDPRDLSSSVIRETVVLPPVLKLIMREVRDDEAHARIWEQNHILTDEEIIARVENAFSPLRCVAQIWDYSSKLRFKVFDSNDDGIHEMPKIALRDIRDERHLEQVLQEVRLRILDKGFVLN
jgi:hypothetical protein